MPEIESYEKVSSDTSKLIMSLIIGITVTVGVVLLMGIYSL